MEIETWVALGAAVATALSAGFIGWQAWETRRSAVSSNKAAEASEAALIVANESLELNRRQAEQSAFMVAEATRARLEANAPAVLMEFVDGEAAQPEAFIVGKGSKREEFRVKEAGELFQLPQDSELWIYALFDVIFHNDGLVPVTVLSQSTLIPTSGDFVLWIENFRIEVGKSANMQIAVGTSLERWADIQTDRMRSRGEAAWGTAMVGDSGVRLTQTIHIDGTVLEHGSKEGDFTLRPFGPDTNYPSFLVKDQPVRTYWLGGQEIPVLATGGAFGAVGPGITP